jgi:hypothetical protein
MASAHSNTKGAPGGEPKRTTVSSSFRQRCEAAKTVGAIVALDMEPQWCHSGSMELDRYVERLQHELQLAAEAGGEDARALAGRLTAPLDSATRLILLEAMAAAADEITRDLAPGSVEVRLRGVKPTFVVTLPPTEEAFETTAVRSPVPAIRADGDEGGTSRINLRLPDSLKLRAEEAAEKEGLSVNAWLVRAVAAALEPDDREGQSRRSSQRGRQSYTGWVR